MIRLMRVEDIPAAIALKQTAGWNQTEQDWANVLALEPEGCWVYEADHQMVGSTTAICYGQDLAWIGMVLVLPELRGRGYGRALMEHALRFLKQRQVRVVRLDATDMGRPLYQRLGFRDECTIERWAGEAPATEPSTPGAASVLEEVTGIATFDRQAFGVDRSKVLECLLAGFPERSFHTDSGYAMSRPGSDAQFLGPCIAQDAAAARNLIAPLLGRDGGQPFFWDLLPANREAQSLAQEFGFERRRRLIRMVLGDEMYAESTRGDSALQFATAGFEYG